MNNWETKKLGEIENCDLIMGQSPLSESYNYTQDGLPFLQGKAEFQYIYPEPIKYTTEPIKIAEKNDILISVRAPVGDVNIAPYKLCIGRGLAAIRFKKDVSKFYYFWFQFKKNFIDNLGMGSTFKALTIDQLKKLDLPIPPIPEQKAITEILTTVDNAIQKSDEAITRTERLKREMMNKLLNNTNWPNCKIKDSKEIQIIMGQSPDSNTYNEEGNGIQFLQGKAEFGVKYPNPIKYTSNPIKLVEKDDILLSVRAPVGDVNISPFELCIGRGLAGLRFKESLSLFYFYWFQNNKNFIESLGAGSTFKAITVEQIKRLELPLATVNEQKEIVIILSDIDKKIEYEKIRKHKFNNIKKSFMNDLLTGKKRIRI